MPFLRRTAFKIIPCLFRVNRTRKHTFPVDSLSGFTHPIVLFSCIWDSVRNICRMGSDFRCYDALSNVLQIRQSQMFRWCNITQEVCTAGCGNCSTDGGSNMVIARLPAALIHRTVHRGTAASVRSYWQRFHSLPYVPGLLP